MHQKEESYHHFFLSYFYLFLAQRALALVLNFLLQRHDVNPFSIVFILIMTKQNSWFGAQLMAMTTTLTILSLQTLFFVQEVPYINSVIDVVETLKVKNNTNRDQ